ncbi:MAG: hypothetical protein MI976_25055 [Pseudomonadales bacterium]|nr:hypothetical protein [Pseudomonadales bacterium]
MSELDSKAYTQWLESIKGHINSAMGFGDQTICVEVKSGTTLVDRPTVDKLRLWSQDDLLEQLFACYDKLDDEIKAEVPLKRVWAVTRSTDD